ncbi:DUF805 domain-containing protein [Selenomonas noxia]|jgi:hypothetical protein
MHSIDHGLKENFFCWEGRLNRKRYIMRLLVLAGVSVALYLFDIMVLMLRLGSPAVYMAQPDMTPGTISALTFGLALILSLLYLPVAVSGYMLMIRRLHDLNLSGFFVLLSFVPIVSFGLIVYLFIKKGTEGDNDYGADLLDAAAVPAHVYDNPYARTDTTSKE